MESLTSYITRLAAAHAVETGILVNRELVTRVPCTKGFYAGALPLTLQASFYVSAYPLNGMGERTRLWVPVLEQLTGIARLDLLTCLPWAKAISCVRLIRTERAWCPLCYGDQTNNPLESELVYDQLLWALQVVKVCPIHRSPLQSHCPFCGRTQYVFSAKTRSGYCSRCQSWLGGTVMPVEAPDAFDLQVAEMIGELLSASPLLPADFDLRQFQENIRTLRQSGQIHNAIRRRNIKGWSKKSAPQMDSLVLLSRSQNVSMLKLLAEPIRINAAVRIPVGHNYRAHYRIAGSIIKEALESALRKDLPPPLEEIANQVGYRCTDPLQRRYRELCAEVMRKRHAALPHPGPPDLIAREKAVPRQKIEHLLSEVLREGRPVTLRSVAQKIGLTTSRRLYKGFHDLRRAIVAQNNLLRQQLRLQRQATIKEALQAALTEAPVPTATEISRRFGYKSVSAITRSFPEQCAALKSIARNALLIRRGHS